MSPWMVLSDEASITAPDAPIMNRLRWGLEDGFPWTKERAKMKECRNMTVFLNCYGLIEIYQVINCKAEHTVYVRQMERENERTIRT